MPVITNKINSPAKTEKVEAVKPAETVEVVTAIKVEEIKKQAGSYDGGYAGENTTGYGGKPEEPAPRAPNSEEKAVPGVPGTAEEKHEEPDGDEDDECECSQCKGSGKMKKAKNTEPEKEESGKYDGKYASEAEEEEKKAESAEEEEEEEKVVPKKATSIDFGMKMGILKPTKEELIEAKSKTIDLDGVFSRNKMISNSIGHKMNAWVVEETARLIQKPKQ